jgi:Uma2 family endonuclease
MSIILREPWTQEEFFAWAAAREGRYEFDGFQPVAMTGGLAGHALVIRNLHFALQSRLRGKACTALGPDAGIENINKAVRYPDALVTCSKFNLTDRTIPGAVAVFEILSPTSGRTDRIVKVREYAAVPSIRRYVILESTSVGLMVLEREKAADPWTTTASTNEDILSMPEIGIHIPVAEFYEDITFPEHDDAFA